MKMTSGTQKINENDLKKNRKYKQFLDFCAKDLRSKERNAIRSSSFIASLLFHHAVVNCDDTGDETTWVATAGASHREATGPPKPGVEDNLAPAI